jgi:NADPH:quinone reductase-like Zn-dependent oxidoreductase
LGKSRGDFLIMRLVLGVSKPKQPILGTELAGVVEAVGPGVSAFRVGDRVFAFSDMAMGCHAEYLCLSESKAVALLPAHLTFEEGAAMSFGGTTALSFFQRGKLQPGERVLVNGASGAVGSAAVQLGRHFGAEVTAVCSAANAEWVRALGAQRVIDYAKEDFTQNGESYDVIMDAVGNAPFSRCGASLKKGGRLLMVLAGLPEMLKIPWLTMKTGKKFIAGPAAGKAEDLRFLAGLAEAGEFKPVIDRVYPFEQIREAYRHVETGHKKGNVVIRVLSAGRDPS